MVRRRLRGGRVRLPALLLGVAFALLLGAAPAAAHAELLTSEPADGAVLAQPPAELRLVFSEAIEKGLSSVDILDATGTAILRNAGAPDPKDPATLVARLPALGAGTYTVEWRTTSTDDGHSASGSFAFSIVAPASASAGPSASPALPTVSPGPPVAGASGGQPTGGAHAAAEDEAKALLYLGFMLAFGLALLSWAVLERLPGGAPRGAIVALGIALLVGGAGSLLLIATSVTAPGTAIHADPIGYATETRPGLLLLVRSAAGILGGVAVLALARLGRRGRAGDVGAFAATAALVLTSISGHAAAFDSPGPVAADAVHLGAASVWLAGLVVLSAPVLSASALAGAEKRTSLWSLVPRLSAIFLVAVALLALTGVYAAWLETRDFTALPDLYSQTLAVKVVIALVAFAVGALNYIDASRLGDHPGGLGARVRLEALLAMSVVVVTAALSTGVPAASHLGIELAPGAGTTPDPIALELTPGRPGPNRAIVRLPGAPSGVSAALDLVPITGTGAPLAADLRPAPDGTYVADLGTLEPDSAWAASVVVTALAGGQATRTFTFALDRETVSAGRATPPLDPTLVIAVLLTGLGAVAVVAGLARRRLPLVSPAESRIALLAGGAVGLGLGILLLVGGPRL